MTDDLLTAFRSEITLPNQATARRIYALATTSRPRSLPRRRLVLAITVAAAICAAVPAVIFTRASGGEAPTSGPTRNMGYDYQSEKFKGSDHSIDSIDMTIRATIAGAALRVQVFRSDTPQEPPPPSPDNAGSQLVFQEQVPMTDLASPEPDGTLSTWSGRLAPSDWDGGCQNALYRVETTVYPVGSSNPWGGGYTAWFQCSGPALDPNNPSPH